MQCWQKHVVPYARCFHSGVDPSEVNLADGGSRHVDPDYDCSTCLLPKLPAMIPRAGGRDDSGEGSLVKRV